jgi:hypothetical protein
MTALVSCNSQETLPIPSLRENLPKLEEAARVWRPDAYLANAELPIRYGSPGPWLVSAIFNSPFEQFEGVLMFLNQDGSIKTEIVPHTVPVVQVEPIESDDWKLDSQEALDIGLDDQGLRYLEEHPRAGCSFLSLDRSGVEPGSPVVWRLVLSDCLDPWTGQTTVIDATTGEVISRDTHRPPAP